MAWSVQAGGTCAMAQHEGSYSLLTCWWRSRARLRCCCTPPDGPLRRSWIARGPQICVFAKRIALVLDVCN